MSLYKLEKKNTGHSMTKLWTDNGREFLAKEFQDYIMTKAFVTSSLLPIPLNKTVLVNTTTKS